MTTETKIANPLALSNHGKEVLSSDHPNLVTRGFAQLQAYDIQHRSGRGIY